MAVYYKFKSARDFDSIAMDGLFISVGTLKEKIFESKHLGRGTDFDLVVTNAQTNEEYLDEAMLIPKNTSVLIRRVPGRPRMPIVAAQEPKVENQTKNAQPEKINFLDAESSVPKYTEDTEWDEFGNDLYSIPETLPVQSSNPVHNAPPSNKADEDNKIKALIDTPALDWQRQGADGFGPGRGFGRGMGGRMGGRGFGLERKTPPPGYVCHRCKVPGHFIQHCPTNGDPNYDIKRVKPPTGIPKSMLMATPDGSYALPSGAVAVLKPNEAAFEREIEGLPSTRPVGDSRPIGTAEPMPLEGSVRSAPRPASITDARAVAAHAAHNLYFSAIAFIHAVKRGPFAEHSPVLYDVSGVTAGWGKINKGMLKMFNAEVLAKFPVVQHFRFGALFAWAPDPHTVAPPVNSVHLRNQPHHLFQKKPAPQASPHPAVGGMAPPMGGAGTMAPWAVAGNTGRDNASAAASARASSAGTAAWAEATRMPASSVARGVGGGIPYSRVSGDMSTSRSGPTSEVPGNGGGVGDSSTVTAQASTRAPWAK